MSLFYLIAYFIAMSFVTEAIVELLVKSVIFSPLRRQVSRIGSWFEELVKCGYCLSVWVAFPLVLLVGTPMTLSGTAVLDLLLSGFIVHRLSNYLHNFNDKWLDKYYDLRYTNTDKG